VYSTWRQIGVRVRVLAAVGEAEEAVVKAVGRGGTGRVMAIGVDGGGRLVIEIVTDVEWRGGRHPSRLPRNGIESMRGPEIHKQGIGLTTGHHKEYGKFEQMIPPAKLPCIHKGKHRSFKLIML
jgi:hypothetical protein